MLADQHLRGPPRCDGPLGGGRDLAKSQHHHRGSYQLTGKRRAWQCAAGVRTPGPRRTRAPAWLADATRCR